MTDLPLARLGRILLVGCGNMGGAMLRRWIEAELPATAITVVDPGTPMVPAGVRMVAAIAETDRADTLVLAVKPQQLGALTADPGFKGLHPKLTISILAGVEEATLVGHVGAGVIVRAMPNLPVAIGKGVVALFSSRRNEAADACDDASALMQPLGLVEWIDREGQFDVVTALSGCGPGFVFRFADALARAGTALGLDQAQALRLALATLEGAATMAAASDEAPPRWPIASPAPAARHAKGSMSSTMTMCSSG